MNQCPRCHRYLILRQKCFCSLWEFRRDGGSEVISIWVNPLDPEDAAASIVEANFENWEYPREVDIQVRPSGETEWRQFTVEVESVPSFSAREVELKG